MNSRFCLYIVFFFSSVFSVCSQNEPVRIDAHIHLYDTHREGSYTFLKGNETIKPDLFEPHLQATFLAAARPSGFSYTYVVEASTRREDNFWLSEIADTSTHVLGFTANLNPLAPSFVEDLDALIKNPKFRGVRPRIKGLDLSDTAVINAFAELEKRQLVLELNSIKDVLSIAHKYPQLTIVVNHFGSIRLKDGQIPNADEYKRLLKAVGECENVYMKVSALHTISGKKPAPTHMAYYKPLIDATLDAFGVNRVIFGSNWPLSRLGGSYNNAVSILEAYCNARQDLDSDLLFRANAVKAYGLKLD